MIIITAFAVLSFSLTFIAIRWKRSGLDDIPMWFVITAVLLVLLAYVTNAVTIGPGISGWAYRGLLVVSAGLACFMVGATLMKSVQTDSPRGVQTSTVVSESIAAKRLMVFALVTLLPSWLYFLFLGYVPLFEGVGAVANEGLDGLGALQAARLSRDAYASDNGVLIPGQGFLQLMRNVGVPALAGYAVAQIRTYGYSKFRLVVLVLATVTVLLAGQRWPLLYLGVAILAAMAVKKTTFSFSQVLKVAAPVLLIGVVVSILQRRTLSTFDSWFSAVIFAVKDLFNRVIFDQSYVSLLSYEKNTYPGGSLLGRSYLDSLAAYAPGPGVSFPVEFYMEVTETPYAYTASPDFFTEAFINFGMIGVVSISFIWGVMLQAVSRQIISKDETLNAGLKSGAVAVLAQSAYTGAVFTLGGAIIFFVVLCAVIVLVPNRTPRTIPEPSKRKATRRSSRNQMNRMGIF